MPERNLVRMQEIAAQIGHVGNLRGRAVESIADNGMSDAR
jgi:hypothetical protein